MDQLGHTDPTFTLRVSGHGMRRDPQARAALSELVGELKRQRKGSSGESERLGAGIGSPADPRDLAL
jgi:hypothetical protein